MARLCKVLLVAILTENLVFLENEGSILHRLLAAVASEVFRVPHLAHGTGKWTPEETKIEMISLALAQSDCRSSQIKSTLKGLK